MIWGRFLCYWPFFRGIHWWLVFFFFTKCQTCGILVLLLLQTGTTYWTKSRFAGVLRRHDGHVMSLLWFYDTVNQNIVETAAVRSESLLLIHQYIKSVDLEPGSRLNIKMPSYQCRDPHYKDKTIWRPSHLYNGNLHTSRGSTVKPVCNDHLYNKIFYLWFIQ